VIGAHTDRIDAELAEALRQHDARILVEINQGGTEWKFSGGGQSYK
jgi:stress response protein SCP2